MGLFTKLFSKKATNNETSDETAKNTFTVPIGGTEIEVYGDQYRNKTLKAAYGNIGNSITVIAITPPVQYQIDKGWPSLPFVNVNTRGAMSTTYDNWLGYIPYKYGSEVDFDKLIDKYKYIEASAKIEKRQGSYEIMLLVSSLTNINVQHEGEHHKVIAMAIKHGYEKMDVKLLPEMIDSGRNNGKMRYCVEFRGYPVGYISVPQSAKVKDYIKDSNYSATITLHRYDEHPNYSKLSVIVI